MDQQRRDRIAQWAFDCKGLLGRFHLWLEDVEERWVSGEPGDEPPFVGRSLEHAFVTGTAVTALGTRLFGRYGEGRGLSKTEINAIKKDADATSAYALSEALWYLTRNLPENHAVMVSMGEGLMPKAGETPEMGSNPLLGFGRVYARAQVARFLDGLVRRLINEPGYGFESFWSDVRSAGVTVWGAAIDTLENTSRFATGARTGPMTVLHLFDQPLVVARPYEAYMGTLTLPRLVVEKATEQSVLINFRTPRDKVMAAIRSAYPGIEPEDVHVWTLRGESREVRIGKLWQEWRSLGASLVEDGWQVPGAGEAFTSAGTYAPTYCVRKWEDDRGRPHVFVVDGYAASAEALQAASLDPILETHTCLRVFSPRFKTSYEREQNLMGLPPEDPEFSARLAEVFGRAVDEDETELYRGLIRDARAVGMPLDKASATIDDFFPQKRWEVLAVASYMLPDPYTGAPGIEEVSPGVFQVTTRASTRRGAVEVTQRIRLLEPLDEMRLVFSPLLDRFYAGQDYKTRPVKISDSGRIRNELQTLASEAIEYCGNEGICVHFENIDDAVLSEDKRALIRDVLLWYKRNHPLWFRWLVNE